MKLMKKEMDIFSLNWQNTIGELKSEDDKQRKQLEFNAVIGSLKEANRRFIRAIVFSSVATLILLLLGFQEAFACVIMLFWAPLLIANMEKNHYSVSDSEKLYPIPVIEKKTDFRNLFASAVWSIGIALAVANAIFYWGKAEGFELPF